MTANGLLLQDGEVWVEDDGQQVPRVFSLRGSGSGCGFVRGGD